MSDSNDLPTIWDSIWNWFGVRAPIIPMPQTLKNLDKAIGKVVLASGENIEARIKANTGKSKAQGKIDVAGMFRNSEEQRKLENRAAITKGAIEDIASNSGDTDAKAEIEDDWLNLFARLAEDKSSEELQGLFSKILAGEIRRPGSFSLRTIQLLATISKKDAEAVSEFLSFALSRVVVPFIDDYATGPTIAVRLLKAELGIASHPNEIGGFAYNPSIPPNVKFLLEPIQEEWIHEQGVGLVSRLSMRRIIARRTKAATVLA
jgi:hypothetical protein